MSGLSLNEFATRSGVSISTVSRALRGGRLALLPDGGIDPALLKTQWRVCVTPKRDTTTDAPPELEINADGTPKQRRGRPLKRPTDAQPSTATEYARIALEKERSLAGLRALEYEQKAGSLIGMDVARRVLFEQGRAARDAWLNWPARVAPGIAAALDIDADALMRALASAVSRQLDSMGEPQADFAARHE